MGLKDKIGAEALKATKEQLQRQIKLLQEIEKSNIEIRNTINLIIDDLQHGFKTVIKKLEDK